ncbi:MAG TPA: metallophosphoesterase [Chthonomonadaceae bacterium]|nr:metallophosphoesterase [Chthonomonadaceae bacterium]
MNAISRRALLTGALGAAGASLTPAALAEPRPDFTFVHITDTHIQPELGATEGVHKAFEAVRALPRKPAFGLVGGDLVMDAALVPHARADAVYDLWRQEAERLGMPLHYSIGNHDLFGLKVDGKPATDDLDYGKALWKRRVGVEQTYASFDHHGWRFVTLDSVGITPDHKWEGALHDAQIAWLDDLLRGTPRTMPLVFVTHFPIFTAVEQYTSGPQAAPTADTLVKNGKQFKEMIQRHNAKAVFQGHTHIVEEITYLGVRYITGGAVCGDWWKGPRLGVHPEGFVAASVKGEELSWRYVPYGWRART